MVALALSALIVLSAPRPTVAVLPPTPTGEAETWVGLAVADNVYSRLLVHSRFDPKTLERLYPLNVFSWRQALSAARSEGIKTGAAVTKADQKRLLRSLGADRLWSGTYRVDNGGVTLTWSLFDGKSGKAQTAKLQLDKLAEASEGLAGAILNALGQDPKRLGGHRLRDLPLAAMRPYGQALEIMKTQSMDPRAKVVLPPEELARAYLLLTAATDASPTFVRAWVERGMVSTMTGHRERSEEELVQAVAHAGEFDPSNALGLYYMYATREKSADAIRVLEEATSTHLGFLHGTGYLGQAYARSGANYKALEIFTQYHARVPKSPWARRQRARALGAIGKHDLAVEESKKILSDFPESLAAAANLAARLIDAKIYPEARSVLEKAMAQHSNHPSLIARLATVEIESGEPAAALELAQRAVTQLGAGRGEALAGYAHLTLAHALGLAGKDKEAYAAMKKALALGITAEDRLMLIRDKRLRKLLQNPRSPIHYEGQGHSH